MAWEGVLLSWLVLLIFLATGCATAGTSAYSRVPASPKTVENEILVTRSFEETWDQLVKGLARSFYVINNIEKASRIINVSFSTESPEKYIDCGKSRRTYERGNDRREYVYDVASSSSFMIAASQGRFPVTHFVNRGTSLEGRVNVYVAPRENNTVVSVNSRYIFTVRISGYSVVENAYGTPVQNVPATPESRKLSFSTNEPNKADWGTPQTPEYVTCYSTGKLEADILSLVR